MRVFSTFTRGNEHVLLALGSNRTGRDVVEISWGGGQSTCSCRFICVKPRETNRIFGKFCTLIISYTAKLKLFIFVRIIRNYTVPLCQVNPRCILFVL